MGAPGWKPYEEAAAPAWDRFASSHPHGRFIHLAGFKRTVESVYGLRSNYWLYEDVDRLRAVFPSFFHRGVVYGRRLVSQPFSEYGGILFSPDAAPSERQAILADFARVLEESRKLARMDYLEIRGFPDLGGLQTGLFGKIRVSDSASLPLVPGFVLWDRVDYGVRKNVRRARSSGLVLSQLQTPGDIADIFYPLHLRSLKRLGSPPHPLSYYLDLQRHLGEHIRLSAASLGGRPIGALLGWLVGRSMQITEIVTDERFFRYRASDLLHFELIDWAVRNGCRLFDFGPVRYAGQRQYKKKWGVEVRGHFYYYAPGQKGRAPLSDRSLPARAARTIWRRVPAGLAARVGRLLRKELAI
jgi:CelD/BcsL family acetyltransferase involved in cellulose biosynthesis